MSARAYAGTGILPGFFEPCTLLKRVDADTRDGQGGCGGTWEDGEAFEAKIRKETIAPHEAVLAGRQDLGERYIVVIPAAMALHYDGDQIDYTGMVVTLYDADGNPCTNGGIYPNGIVPIEALELPKIAYKDKTDVVNLLCVGLKTSQQITASFEITIKANPYPVHIDVTTPPNKLTYQDGGDIDYSGMVVTGYDRHGAVWGNVPMKMLTLPKKASWANAGIQFHDNLEVGTSFIYWMNNWWKTDDAYSNIVIAKEFVIENGYLAYFFYDGWSMRSISVVACSAFNNAEMYQFDIYDDGRRELNKTYKLTSQKTTDDKTVYYTDYEISGVYRSNSIGPYNNEYAGWSNVASIAWRMFYGETAENRIQVIPVTIEDPIKNRVIKSAFNITVMP